MITHSVFVKFFTKLVIYFVKSKAGVWPGFLHCISYIARTCGVVVFDNEPLEASVTRLHERRSLEPNWIKPAESGSLSNTTTTYLLIFIIHAEFNCVTYVLFYWVNIKISSIKNSNFVQFMLCELLELGNTSRDAFWLLRSPQCVPHCDVGDANVTVLSGHREQ